MTFYAIYHRPTNTFTTDASFLPSAYNRFFIEFCKDTKIYGSPAYPKAYITSALKSCKQNQKLSNVAEATQFALGLEVIEVEIQTQIQKSIYSASFHLDEI